MWDRVISSYIGLKESLVELTTAGGMWIKKFRNGLRCEPRFKF